MKAQELGLASRRVSAEELYQEAQTAILHARDMTQVLMNSGVIAPKKSGASSTSR
jgi:hypothetical protein